MHYAISPASDPDHLFHVDAAGAVRVAGGLDREKTPAHTLLVWAADDGVPPQTATATLTVTVTDVNDNPPFLSDPEEGVEVEENGGAKVVARVKLGDADDWRLGHGPPFSLALDPQAPTHVSSLVKVEFDPKGDDGRGVGVVWVQGPLDREERNALLVPLVVGDAAPQPCTATVTLTLTVGDQDDNPPMPAAKTVVAHVLKQGDVSGRVPLGRVFVKDPDERVEERTYAWRVPPSFQGFTLHPATGHLDMAPAAPPGRYDLQFEVITPSQGQVAIPANVSILVEQVTSEDVASAVPLTLPAPPSRVIGTSVLHKLVEAAQAYLGLQEGGVRAMTLQAGNQGAAQPHDTTHVWLVGPDASALHHSLLYRREQLSHTLGVGVVEVGVGECLETDSPSPHLELCDEERVGCYSVVDADSVAVVGPRMRFGFGCGCECGRRRGCERCALATAPPTHTCTERSCLNGGRCYPTTEGVRCACPLSTAGTTCKVFMRHFRGEENTGGWAWVAAIPPCPEVHISLEILTASREAILLYSGPDHVAPMAPLPEAGASREVLLLELRGGRPFLMLDLGDGTVTLSLTASYSLADSTWHRIDVIWRDELVEMVVDLCSGGGVDGPSTHVTDDSTTTMPPLFVPPDAHTCRGADRLPAAARSLNYLRPLQVGGLAHPAPAHDTYGWPEPIKARQLKGCIRNLRVNGELRDLGQGVLSSGSVPGCPAAECPSNSLNCGLHGRCQVLDGATRCECTSGWAGPECSMPTTPSTFHLHSFVRLALSFSPLGYTTSVSLRFRTRQTDGDLVMLSSGGGDRFGVHLLRGHACVLLQLHPAAPRTLCLVQVRLTDGQWHQLHAARYGSATFLTADEGDGDLYNASISLEGRQLLHLDWEAGVVIGGTPHSGGNAEAASQRDFLEGCLDDVRISGRPVPLPPILNKTAWGYVSEARGVGAGCEAPQACHNVTCRSPLTCVDTWRSYHCTCDEGRVMSEDGSRCLALNPCAWNPCLHGGTCLPTDTGFTCSCSSGFAGQHCQLPVPGAASLRLSLPGLLALLVCILLLLLVCAFLLHQHHRRSALRRGAGDGKESTTPVGTKGQMSPSHPGSHSPYLLELRPIPPTRVNGQLATSTYPNIADVDVLQVDAASITSSVEEQQQIQLWGCLGSQAEGEGGGGPADKREEQSVRNDPRTYAHERGGSFPGSLSSVQKAATGNPRA